MALATGSHQAEFNMKSSSHADLFSTFKHTVCASDDPEVKHGKPAPDCFLVASTRFQDPPPPDKVIYIFICYFSTSNYVQIVIIYLSFRIVQPVPTHGLLLCNSKVIQRCVTFSLCITFFLT